MKNGLQLTLLLLLTLAISCKKSDPPPAPAVKFMSFTTGSTWNYKQTDNTAGTTQNFTRTATANDTLANGRTYKIFSNSSGPNEYYAISGNDYYTFWKLPGGLGGTSLEVLYLKDNLAVGGTWQQSFPISVSGFNLTLTLNSKIAQKAISKVVNSITYNNVTDVETTLSLSGLPIPINLTTNIHNYYAPKVGEIENKLLLNLSVTGTPPTNIDQKLELLSANIL